MTPCRSIGCAGHAEPLDPDGLCWRCREEVNSLHQADKDWSVANIAAVILVVIAALAIIAMVNPTLFP
jgi:hypothetical protein